MLCNIPARWLLTSLTHLPSLPFWEIVQDDRMHDKEQFSPMLSFSLIILISKFCNDSTNSWVLFFFCFFYLDWFQAIYYLRLKYGKYFWYVFVQTCAVDLYLFIRQGNILMCEYMTNKAALILIRLRIQFGRRITVYNAWLITWRVCFPWEHLALRQRHYSSFYHPQNVELHLHNPYFVLLLWMWSCRILFQG